MEKMFEKAPHSSFEEIKGILQQELGEKWEDHFSVFEK